MPSGRDSAAVRGLRLTTGTVALWLVRLAGLGLLIGILVFIDMGEAISTLADASLPWVALAVALASVSMVVRGWRWAFVARATGLHYQRFADYLLPFYAGAFLGIALPQTAASFAPVAYMSVDGHPWRRSALSIVLDRAVEGIVTLAVGVVAALYLAGTYPELTLGLLAACTVAALALIVAALALRYAPGAPGLSGLRRAVERARDALSTALAGANLVRLATTMGAASLVVIALESAFIVAAARALDLEVGALFMAASWSLVALVQSLPISLLGLGPREGFLVLLFDAAGHPRDDAVALGLLIFALALVIRLPGALVLLYRPSARRAAPTSPEGAD